VDLTSTQFAFATNSRQLRAGCLPHNTRNTMTTTTRIYIVSNKLPRVGESVTEKRLVRAINASQAMRFVAQDTLQVAISKQEDLIELISAGIKVEDCKAE
jgi:hypothetical protein